MGTQVREGGPLGWRDGAGQAEQVLLRTHLGRACGGPVRGRAGKTDIQGAPGFLAPCVFSQETITESCSSRSRG